MILEIDGTEEYEIIESYSLSKYSGKFRIIKYLEGNYYAIQKLYSEETSDWQTILITPIMDIKENYNDKIIESIEIDYGLDIIHEIMNIIIEADNNINGKYWELKLYLSEEGDTYFTEIITKGDGESLLEQITELYSLEKQQRELYLKEYPKLQKYKYLVYIFCIILIIVIISIF